MSKNEKTDRVAIRMRAALALHDNIRHIHWTTPIKDKAGTIIGTQHHHFLHEAHLTTGVYASGPDARERLTDLLISYFPSLQGALVQHAGKRGFKLRTTLSEEELALARAERAEEESDGGKKARKGLSLLKGEALKQAQQDAEIREAVA